MSSVNGDYRQGVEISPDIRRIRFTDFVRKMVSRAREIRGWDPRDIAEHSNGAVSMNTIYRWIKGDWVEPPEGNKLAGFCKALDIPPSVAFSILWPDGDRATAPEPIPVSPAMELIARKLEDPNVPDVEKYLISQTLETLAARPKQPRT